MDNPLKFILCIALVPCIILFLIFKLDGIGKIATILMCLIVSALLVNETYLKRKYDDINIIFITLPVIIAILIGIIIILVNT